MFYSDILTIEPRQRLLFNDNWRFHLGDVPGAQTSGAQTPGAQTSGAQTSDYNDSNWRLLDLPHDWGVEGDFDIDLPGESGKLPWAGVGWYRKTFEIVESESGQCVSLEIDGAMSNAEVWCNGQRAGGWPCGYSSWALDLTPFVHNGANVLAIRLDNPPDSSRWYPGGGIYRNVHLTLTNPVHVAHWGTQITARTQENAAHVGAQITLRNDGKTARAVRLNLTVVNAQGRAVATAQAPLELAAASEQIVDEKLLVESARRWSLDERHLYTLICQIESDGEILDRTNTRFGVRDIEWSAQRGFSLNGEVVPLRGVCLHHDLGALGAAWNARAARRQLQILQDMGANAIRTSHNPPAPEWLDLCDEMGFLVIDEFSDTWKDAKKPNGYAQLFDEWAQRDVTALVRRDRNHPCVIAWSSGNEVGEQWSEAGHQTSCWLTDLFHDLDATRPVTTGNNLNDAGTNGFEKTVDVFGYNYKPHLYARFARDNPNIPLYGSETASTISSRGEYFFPVSSDAADNEVDFQVSSYDLYFPNWAQTPDVEFAGQDQNPFVAGEFVWTGFDYLGEPTPYNSDATNLLNYSDPAERARAARQLAELGRVKSPARSSYFGIVDLAGFPKDRYYLYQSRWRPDLPMAHILPHWNWPNRVGQITPVHVYTSGDEAELFLNGVSQGRRKKAQFEYRLRWDEVKYQPGELRVVTYKNGKLWARETVKTTGAPAQIRLSADRNAIASDGADLSFVTVRVTDAAGVTVPRSHDELSFSIEGPGEIVATDNGDATDLTAFGSHTKKAFNGLALVIVRARKGARGAIALRIEADGLKGAEIQIVARDAA